LQTLIGDGYPDYLDLCPTQPETFNGIDDTDGCPDNEFSLLDRDLRRNL